MFWGAPSIDIEQTSSYCENKLRSLVLAKVFKVPSTDIGYKKLSEKRESEENNFPYENPLVSYEKIHISWIKIFISLLCEDLFMKKN